MLTQRMQVQAIADRLAGRPVRPGLRAAHFAEPWRVCWNALEEYGGSQRAATEMLERVAAAGGDVQAVSQALMKAAHGLPPTFRPLSDIAASLPPVRWLWQPWIPLDMITLIGAAPGVGKTSVLLDICRRILAGDAFPDGTAMPEWAAGRNVIFVDGEGVPQVINARTQSWGMDTGRFYLMEPDDGDEIDFDRAASRDLLVEMVAALNPALVAIDSLGAVTSRGENSIDDVRGVMKFFKSVALDGSCAFVVNHHVRKRNPLAPSGFPTLDDFRGHGHITMMARSVFGIGMVQTGPEPDPNGPREIGIVKTNLAPAPARLGFELVPQPDAAFYLKYGEVAQPYREPLRRDDCASWLLETLEDHGGRMKPAVVIALAGESGYSERMVYRTRKLLAARIRDAYPRRNPLNEWILEAMTGPKAPPP